MTETSCPPFQKGIYPFGAQLVPWLASALGQAECESDVALTQKQIAHFTGIPISTLHDWYPHTPPSAVLSFLRILERLSVDQLETFRKGFLRPCVRLPSLRLDAGTLSRLRRLLLQPCGLTWVCGGSEAQRAQVLTALGNSVSWENPQATVSGLDRHFPESWAPVPGVLYRTRGASVADLRTALTNLWRSIEENPSRFTLLNGIWSLAPSLRPKILRLARQRHVVVADRPPRNPVRLAGKATIQAVVITAQIAGTFRLSVRCQPQLGGGSI